MPLYMRRDYLLFYSLLIVIPSCYCRICMYVFSSGLYTSFPTNGLTSPRAVLAQTIPPCKQRSTSLIKSYPEADDEIL